MIYSGQLTSEKFYKQDNNKLTPNHNVINEQLNNINMSLELTGYCRKEKNASSQIVLSEGVTAKINPRTKCYTLSGKNANGEAVVKMGVKQETIDQLKTEGIVVKD